MNALRVRSKERALLASLVSRRCRMSEAFSHAYTSSMVRAGEALGYDDLGEIVQDERTKTSTLLPFDILSDISGAWEDPCRPIGGFIPGLDSDEIFKRAHARAMIQKSLKKLQDRHLIKGGTSIAGPYAEVQPSDQGKLTIKTANGISSTSPPKSSPRSASGTKRKMSISSSYDVIGSSLFNPNHYSSPFVWDVDDMEYKPYGRTSYYEEKAFTPNKRPRLSSSSQIGAQIDQQDVDLKESWANNTENSNIIRSTHEIEWSNVAEMFRPVLISEKSSSRINDHHSVAVPIGSTIIAPYCRKFTISDFSAGDDLCTISDDEEEEDMESDSEEDLNDEKILAAHQKVLDHIREKFDAMMLVRQQIQERQRRVR